MKTFKKDHLPDTLIYKGEMYWINNDITTGWQRNNTPLKEITATLKKEGRKAVLVNCMEKNVKGKRDLHGELYKPSQFIYTTQSK